MNKSLEFIKKQIEEKKVSDNFNVNGWEEETIVIDNLFEVLKDVLTKKAYDTYFSKNRYKAKVHNGFENLERTITIKYDPEAEFEYFYSLELGIDEKVPESLNKGLLSFVSQITEGLSYNTISAPKDYSTKFIEYDVSYVIGDILIKQEKPREYKTDPKGQIDILSSVAFAIPIKISYKKNGNTTPEQDNTQN